jgi:hypothetical protein
MPGLLLFIALFKPLISDVYILQGMPSLDRGPGNDRSRSEVRKNPERHAMPVIYPDLL